MIVLGGGLRVPYPLAAGRRAVLAGKNMETVLDGAWRSEGHG